MGSLWAYKNPFNQDLFINIAIPQHPKDIMKSNEQRKLKNPRINTFDDP